MDVGTPTQSPEAKVPIRQIRATYTVRSIRVYQAFSREIAEVALAAQTFKPPFGMGRMTWIKPSFTWMLYRSGYGRKPNQEHLLAIEITRSGFEWAMEHSCATSFDPDLYPSYEEWRRRLEAAPVRIQWDPEKTVRLDALPWRSLQVGLGPAAIRRYLAEWILSIEEVTPLAREIEAAVKEGDLNSAEALGPVEAPYPLPENLSRRIGCTG